MKPLQWLAAVLITATPACGSGTFKVTVSGSNVSVSPHGTVQVKSGAMQSFTVTPSESYRVSSSVGGSCPAGNWVDNVYTTGAIKADCSVSFTATQVTFQVTASGDGHETISPAGPQTIDLGASATFIVSADTGYATSSVGGTCPAGTWSGSSYTTGAISLDCSVLFTAAPLTFQVTASGDGHESISPTGAQTVARGNTSSFTVAASTGYGLSTAVGGTCPAGTWSDGVYTTGAITADCSVSFAATIDTFTVTASGDGRETLSPTMATVSYGATQLFGVTPNAGYTLLSTVGGTCPVGSWSAAGYTTGVVTANCTVSFSATPNQYQVTTSGDGFEAITPSLAQTVGYDAEVTLTVVPNAGYSVSTSVGGTCPAGTWTGDQYTFGPITSDCGVVFSASPIEYTVTVSSSPNVTAGAPAPSLVNSGATSSITVKAASGYTLSSTVGGTCPAGSWANDPIVGCYIWSSGGLVEVLENGTIKRGSASGTWTVEGGSYVFQWGGSTDTLSLEYGNLYGTDQTSAPVHGDGATCTDGNGSSNVYTTGPLQDDCTVSFSGVAYEYQVTSSGDGYENITPASLQWVTRGDTQSFTVEPSAGYVVAERISGSCPIGSWAGDVYTTGAIDDDCTVVFTATAMWQVTPGGDTWETITPSTPQTILNGDSASFTVTPTNGYVVDPYPTGNCPAGNWSGDVYTTGPITADCSVEFSAFTTSTTFQVTTTFDSTQVQVEVGSAPIDSGTVETVGAVQTESFTVTASTGYVVDPYPAGTCPAGSWSGDVYTTGSIAADCTVIFSAIAVGATFQVTATFDSTELVVQVNNENIASGTTQTIGALQTQMYAVIPIGDYAVNMTVGGTCPPGGWSTIYITEFYTTGEIAGDCTVVFSALQN